MMVQAGTAWAPLGAPLCEKVETEEYGEDSVDTTTSLSTSFAHHITAVESTARGNPLYLAVGSPEYTDRFFSAGQGTVVPV